MNDLKFAECGTCEVQGQFASTDEVCPTCGDNLIPLELIAAAELEALRNALKLAEWGRWSPRENPACPVCHNEQREGHADNCKLAAALK